MRPRRDVATHRRTPCRTTLPRYGAIGRRAFGGVVIVLLAVMASASAKAPVTAQPDAPIEWLWIEGEHATRHDFNQHSWYCCDGLQGDLLSPGEPGGESGDWLAHYANDGSPATAEYVLDIKKSGRYALWLRLSSYQALYRWEVEGSPAVDLDPGSDPREYINLLADRRPELRYLSWQLAGLVDLEAGERSLAITVLGHPERNGGREVHGGVDAILLVEDGAPWGPTGTLKPPDGLDPQPEAGDWFPFIPFDDPFDASSVTDATSLLHAPAGQQGHIESAGDGLRFADGTNAVFWGVNAHPPATDVLAERQARWLAKQGVNLVRLHPVQSVVGLLSVEQIGEDRRFDPAGLDRLDRWFAILKRHGIYMAWSPFYPHIITEADGYPPALMAELPEANTWNMPQGTSGRSSSGVVNFMRSLQDAEWDWLRPLLQHENPYTGIRYVNDPALAFVETHNEDSIFWHYPLNELQRGEMPLHLAELQTMWTAWLRGIYDDDDALLSAWGPPGAGSRPDDSLNNERMLIYGAWEFGAEGPPQHPHEQRRLGDWIRFLAETQREYYERREARLRALGYNGVTITTAWMAGGPAAHAANLWTDDAATAIDRHAYFGGGEGGHSVRAGTVNSGTHLTRPGTGILARGMEQVEDKPFVMSEWTQSPPNQWKAEIAPLIAFYGFGLHGWDGSIHFAADQHGRFGGGWPDERSYVTETPHYAGQFAALARSIHLNHFSKGPLAAARRLTLDEIFRGIDPLTHPSADGGWDGAGVSLDTPPEVFAIGRTTMAIGNELGPSERLDWQSYWDQDAGVVNSATGELRWDMARRVVEARGQRTQALIGWAGGHSWSLPDVDVEVHTPFVSLIFSPLDDRPLGESGQILITALARDRQAGARYSADGGRLEAVGAPPLLLEPVQAQVTFRGAQLTSARRLDIHGVPIGEDIERSGNTIAIDGRWRAFRYEVRTVNFDGDPEWTVLLPLLARGQLNAR